MHKPLYRESTQNPTSNDTVIQPDIKELILCNDPSAFVCDTFIFEPSPGEESLGFLFAAGETETRDGVGKELLDTVVGAIQQEYYRDPQRLPGTSLEMALHQANLILHDTSERGVKDWMGYFHVSVGVLVGNQLHISVAGGGKVLLARRARITDIAEGLAHYPIINPLQTFSQLASGEVLPRDTLFFSTVHFDSIFRSTDVSRFTLDHSAATISSRLEQLYNDQGHSLPLSLITVTLLPQYAMHTKESFPNFKESGNTLLDGDEPVERERRTISQDHLRPHKPLVIRRTAIQSLFIFLYKFFVGLFRIARLYIWPVVKQSSTRGGRVLARASRATGRHMFTIAGRSTLSLKNRNLPEKISTGILALNGKLIMGSAIRWLYMLPGRIKSGIRALPLSSKLFGIIALILVIALTTSLILLQKKRAADAELEKASRILVEARTKKDAAETALIYGNREQARGFLEDARSLTDELVKTGIHAEQAKELTSDIEEQYDRLQRITRAKAADIRAVGDVGTLIGKTPAVLFYVNDYLYTANPDNNAIVKLGLDGTAEVVQQITQGIGFIKGGAVQYADKTIVLSTEPPGIALFDAIDNSLLRQDFSLMNEQSIIADIAAFGSRLYVLDTTEKQIFSYNKTLRGFSGGSPWLVEEGFPKDKMRSIAVDGNIFTLLNDGSIRRMFKGQSAEFEQEKVDPPLSSAKKIVTAEDMQYLYILDPSNNRVVIYDKKGALKQQIYIEANSIADFTVHPDETMLFFLDGTQVIEVKLTD